jgi:hypothetical protein
MKRSPGGVLRREGLTLLMTLGIVYLFVSGTLPAIFERQELGRQRVVADQDLRAAEDRAQRLVDWTEGGWQDPMLRDRLLELMRRDPNSTGYRIIRGTELPAEGDGSGQ